jgi:aspartate kinase
VGVASKMFRTLSEEGINIQMITTSEIKTSVVIDEKYMELAVRALHKAFDLDQPAIASRARGCNPAARMRVFAGVVTEWPKVLPC